MRGAFRGAVGMRVRGPGAICVTLLASAFRNAPRYRITKRVTVTVTMPEGCARYVYRIGYGDEARKDVRNTTNE